MMMTVVTRKTGEAAGTAAGDGLTAAADPMVAFEGVSKRFAAGRTSAEVAALDGVDFVVGTRYLVTAVDGVVTSCGLSGPATPEFEQIFTDVFG